MMTQRKWWCVRKLPFALLKLSRPNHQSLSQSHTSTSSAAATTTKYIYIKIESSVKQSMTVSETTTWAITLPEQQEDSGWEDVVEETTLPPPPPPLQLPPLAGSPAATTTFAGSSDTPTSPAPPSHSQKRGVWIRPSSNATPFIFSNMAHPNKKTKKRSQWTTPLPHVISSIRQKKSMQDNYDRSTTSSDGSIPIATTKQIATKHKRRQALYKSSSSDLSTSSEESSIGYERIAGYFNQDKPTFEVVRVVKDRQRK